MLIQHQEKQINKSKTKLRFEDCRTINCFSNFYIEGNYNPENIQYIDKEINDYYFQFDKCYTCKLDQEVIPPKCLSICRFQTHSIKSRNPFTYKFKGRCCFELKKYTNKYKLFLSRTQLSLNYLLFTLGYKMIIWTGTASGIEIHHKNRKWYDDRIYNLSLLFRNSSDLSHNKIHVLMTRYRDDIIKYNQQLVTYRNGGFKLKNNVINIWKSKDVNEKMVEQKLKDVLKKVNQLNDVVLSSSITKYLNEAQQHINNGIIFEPEWIKKKIEKYKKKYTWI